MSDITSCMDKAVSYLRLKDTSPKLVSLLTYPLNLNAIYEIDKSRLDVFYGSNLVELIKSIFRSYLSKKDVSMLNIIKQSCQICKPDVWLHCVFEELKITKELCDIRFIVQQIENFIFKHHRLSYMFSDIAESKTSSVLTQITDNISRLVSSLPVITANSICGRYHCQLLDNRTYVKAVISGFDYTFLDKPGYAYICGSVVSQLALSGFSSAISDIVIQDLKKAVYSKGDSIWSILLHYIKEKCLESFMQPILLHSPNSEVMKLLLVKEFSSIQKCTFNRYFRLYRRLLFVRYFAKGDIIRNIFIPLFDLLKLNSNNEIVSDIASRVNGELGLPALRLWADSTAIASTSVEQRIYTSQILASWITDFYLPIMRNTVPLPVEGTSNSNTLLPDVLTGISNHLQSTRQEIRILGMAVGEWLVKQLDFELPNKSREHQVNLKFDYDEIDALQLVRPFFTSPMSCSLSNNIDTDSAVKVANVTYDTSSENPQPPPHEDLDSDDDPDPGGSFPLLPSLECQNKDTKLEGDILKSRRPRYLRECLDGLLLAKPEDSQMNLACTAAAADLIYAHPSAAKELVHDFARVLLHIDPPVSPNDAKVEADRHSALVALGVVAPKQCARYLTSEFVQSNLSIGQRTRILSVLTDICCQLSAVGAVNLGCSPERHLPVASTNEQCVLSERLEAKTRRFFSKRPPSKPTKQNAFTKVCGDFFFPLLCNISQLFTASGPFAHQDTGLLANLIAYLATVYACSRFSSVQDRMASELVASLPLLYRHTDCAVRRAVLIAVGTMVTMTPDVVFHTNPRILLWRADELTPASWLPGSPGKAQLSSSSLVEWVKWCMTEDTDSECQLLAQVCLSALADRLSDLTTV